MLFLFDVCMLFNEEQKQPQNKKQHTKTSPLPFLRDSLYEKMRVLRETLVGGGWGRVF
jgi:hypothetical protein